MEKSNPIQKNRIAPVIKQVNLQWALYISRKYLSCNVQQTQAQDDRQYLDSSTRICCIDSFFHSKARRCLEQENVLRKQ